MDEAEKSGKATGKTTVAMDKANRAAVDAAIAVMTAHFAAINARDEQAVNNTLHFPHYRLSQGRLQTWPGPGSYLDDFRARTTADWHHSSLDRHDVVAAGPDKVHLDVEFTRYRQDNSVIGVYRSLWVISCLGGRWAAQLRSSFAD
jgi:hypothetical protein